jgi:hypothetical protein
MIFIPHTISWNKICEWRDQPICGIVQKIVRGLSTNASLTAAAAPNHAVSMVVAKDINLD